MWQNCIQFRQEQKRTEPLKKLLALGFKKHGNRDKVVLASQKLLAGELIRLILEKTDFSKRAIKEALEGSLKRLQTDYIDLYQLHWPERAVNCFGVREYPYQNHSEQFENHLEILETLQGFISEGKIRKIGISNESPWGTMQYLQTAKDHNLPRMSTIQNSYSLLHRAYEYGMSEVSLRENIGLLAFSPLAFGVLSGKYVGGKKTERCTRNLVSKLQQILICSIGKSSDRISKNC